jgi:hypothetical protein
MDFALGELSFMREICFGMGISFGMVSLLDWLLQNGENQTHPVGD